MKKSIIGRIIPRIGIMIVPISTIALIACSNVKRDFSKYKRDFSKIDWTKYLYKDATINSWRDGDTPDVTIKGIDGHDDFKGGIRIAGIDAPEAHYQTKPDKVWHLTKGIELKLAKLSWDFAKKAMPKGTKVRIATDGSKSYNRIVGSLFYGPNFSKNLSVELLARGFVNPFLSNISGFSLEKHNIRNVIALPIADAFNYSYSKKLGIFSAENVKELKIAADKGETHHGSTNFLTVIYDPSLNNHVISDNVYYELGILKAKVSDRRRR